MRSRSKNLNLIVSRLWELIGSETIDQGQKEAVDRAIRKIERGLKRHEMKTVDEGIARLARAFLRRP